MTRPAPFSQAYARYLPPVQAKCRRLLGASSATEDIAQETLVRLWKSGVAVDGDERTIMAWVYRTCTRLAIDVLRDRKKTGDREAAPDATPCGVDVAASAEARAAIVSLASSTPEDELLVAVLCRVDGLAQPEAASVMGVSERTVRRMLDRFDERVSPMRKEFST